MKSIVALVLAASLPGWLHLPTAVQRWLYNPRERTQVAQRHLVAGRTEEAMRALDTAVRLAPEDPLVHYNAGTARMLSGGRGAVDELEAATALAEQYEPQRELAADTWYNLGTARLATRDKAGSVAALTEALRRRPDDEDAKFNLELALAELARQKSGGRDSRESPDAEQQGEQGQGGGGGGTDTDRPAEGSAARDPDSPAEDTPGDTPESRRPQPQTASDDVLQRFEQQPDMSAAQAAAILEAVDNLERAYRREEAERRGGLRQVVEKDW